MKAPYHTIGVWFQRLGEGITLEEAFISLVLALIVMTVTWLGYECAYLRRTTENHAARLDRLQKLVEDVGWRDSRQLTVFDWRRPPA